MSYINTLNEFKNDFKREYGENKARKIINKIENSNGVIKTLQELERISTYPRASDAIATVMNMSYFMFAKKTTVAFGAVYFLETWNQYANKNSKYLDDYNLEQLLKQILNQSLSMM